jgi:uncharacterized membrane protein
VVGLDDSCVLDQNSQYASALGIPAVVLGVAFYGFMIAICSPPAWRSGWRLIRLVRLVVVVFGMLFCPYLVFREIISPGGRICAYCTSVHIITFLLFDLIVFDASGYRPLDSPSRSR